MKPILSLFFLCLVGICSGDDLAPSYLWQLEIFVEQVLLKLKAELPLELDPVTEIKDVELNMTFPSYLVLNGGVRDMSYTGLRNFTIQRMTMSSTYFKVYMLVDSVLSGSHNLHGTITLDDESIVPIGNSEESSSLHLHSNDAEYVMDVYYEVGEDGFIKGRATSYINLQPSQPANWDMDFGGLLDPIKNDEYLFENAISWITLEILEREKVEDDLSDYITSIMYGVLQAAFDEISYDDIIAFPPSTPEPGPPPVKRISIEVRPPVGNVLLHCTASGKPTQGPTTFNTTGGFMTWEWVEPEGALTTWVCWANWGKAILAAWDELGGIVYHRGFNVYGSNFVESVPRQNNTWLLDGNGKARVEANGEPVRDHVLPWDGPIPSELP